MPSPPWPPEPWPSLGRHWRALHGEPVRRVSLDPGFSCPNRDGLLGTAGCIFCDPASFSPSHGDPRPVARQLAAGIAALGESGVRKVAAYFQPRTNTHAPPAVLERLWEEALGFPQVVALCVGTRPDCVPEAVLDGLAAWRERAEVWLELGLQSSRDETLRRLRRGHGAEAFADACRRARGRGLKVCAHVILGLPGEGVEDELATAALLAGLGVEGVKLRQLAVVRGTELEAAWRRGEVPVLGEAEYAARAAAFVRALPRGTVLHRLVGDTPAGRLLAPRFEKGRVLREIREALARE